MKPYHTGVWGDSGGGKTTLLRQMQEEFDGVSIVVNHTDEPRFAGEHVGGIEGMRRAIREGPEWSETRINLRSGRDVETQIREVRQVCHEVWEYAGVPQQVIVDEAWVQLPDYKAESGPQADNPLRDGLHNDRDNGTKYVLAAQDPTDMFYPPVKQCPYHVWVGEPAMQHRGFMDYFGLPRDELMRLSTHEYAVMDKQGNILQRGETQERFS